MAATVYIVFYSLYHHIYTVAKEVQAGLEAQGVTVKLFQVPETLSDDVLQKMGAPPKINVPIIKPEQLTEADGIIWGVPVRFGQAPAQLMSFLDATGGLWAKGALAGKPTSIFFSSGSQHGGQESVVYNTMSYFAHHGMMFVPLGMANPNLGDNSEVVGGSLWGSGTVAGGDGSRQISEKEKEIARSQGENFAKVAIAMTKGKAVLEKAAEKKQPVPPKTDEAKPTPVAKKTVDEKKKTVDEKKKTVDEKKKKKFFKGCICM
ncbi:flavo protein WrbA [Hesseltinella vesiculosa]|uniref:Flavo protein WrbA n=1 Tax=Hesseltinella vesiculosa TaxID=101127 RepID=A0A1X2GYE9_9FUNG|nr:flavo protein WrbA [Hesseltinella vesiculosa]